MPECHSLVLGLKPCKNILRAQGRSCRPQLASPLRERSAIIQQEKSEAGDLALKSIAIRP